MSDESWQPWSTDRDLTIEQVRGAVSSQFPDLGGEDVRLLDSGWDYEAYLIGRDWIFKFPRRKDVAEAIDREVAATVMAAEALADMHIRVPRISKLGEPSNGFPYRFMGYEMLPGAPADDVVRDHAAARALGEQIGGLLTRLHSITGRQDADDELPVTSNGVAQWRADATSAANDLLNWDPGFAAPYVEHLRLLAPPAEYEGPSRFLHNDLCPDHVLMDANRRRIQSLIDFGDAAFGDPALDFVMLPAWLGLQGTRAAFDSYDVSRDTGFDRRIAYLARAASLHWLRDAHLQGTNVAKHREWVARSFAGALAT